MHYSYTKIDYKEALNSCIPREDCLESFHMNFPISSTQPLNTLSKDTIDRINKTHQAVIIADNDEPRAVLVSYEDFETLTETVAVLNELDASASESFLVSVSER